MKLQKKSKMIDLFFDVTIVTLLIIGIFCLKKSDAINQENIESNNELIESNLVLINKLNKFKGDHKNNN